jgi:hypothetical protein
LKEKRKREKKKRKQKEVEEMGKKRGEWGEGLVACYPENKKEIFTCLYIHIYCIL